MPIDPHLTPRQLRIIADRVEQLTNARLNNSAMGVPTTPDRFECRFPSGHRGTVTWAQADLTSAKARERNGGKPVHRYVVQLHQADPEHGIVVQMPNITDEDVTRAASLAHGAHR